MAEVAQTAPRRRQHDLASDNSETTLLGRIFGVLAMSCLASSKRTERLPAPDAGTRAYETCIDCSALAAVAEQVGLH